MVRLSGKTIFVASVLTITTSSQGLLTSASKHEGTYRYNFATVPFLAELLKLIISSVLLQRQRQTNPDAAKVTRHLGTSMLFLVPSVIYWLHNNVQFVTLRYVDPATYQIMGNLKIVTTGLLLWLCLRRQLSPLQWMALALLMIGATVSQHVMIVTGLLVAAAEDRVRGLIIVFSTGDAVKAAGLRMQGYMFGVLSAFMSAMAAVYTEWVMKRNNDSLYWQNMQLYTFGVAFNAFGLILGDLRAGFGGGIWLFTLFKGYDWVTVLVVANLAFSGLLVSWVMKFADSILKVYATSMAMLVTTVASVLFFGLQPSLQLLLGIITASISLVLYYVSPSMLLETGKVQRLPR